MYIDISDSEENISEYEDHTSEESDNETSDDEIENVQTNMSQTNLSKNGKIEWTSKQPDRRGRTPSFNVMKKNPGITRYATSHITNIKTAFQTVFSNVIEKKIIEMTNLEGMQVYGEHWIDLNTNIFEAYVGLLLLAGVYRSYGESTKSLWNKDTGRNIFRATMSLETFTMISRVIRFDDRTSRQERRRCDKLAPIRDIWEKWVDDLPKMYNPGVNVTVDEQLVSFRGRCPFKQYIPSKPAKYGIKIWTLCDSQTSYALKMQIYTGKENGAASEKEQGKRVVSDLSTDLKGNNITCDNFFTSFNLGQLLLKRNITMLGTVRKNKPDLPIYMLNKEVYSSSFYFTNDTTVVNYIPKKNKNVILMSTLHHDIILSCRNDKKPQMILDYNSTKGAVDTLDQLVTTYTCKRKTKRWPMIVFYNILDISAYNALILWTCVEPKWNANKLTRRRLFLEELGKCLIKDHIATRTNMPRTVEARSIVENTQQINNATQSSIHVPTKRSRCKFCPSNNDKKTNIMCYKCHKYICKLHCECLCPSCKT